MVDSDTLATREQLTQGMNPETMKGSKKKEDHQAPALLTKICPQRRARDERGHKGFHAAH
jgi:hypothetical protein